MPTDDVAQSQDLRSGPCDPNYVTDLGTPCVPGGDFDCADLEQWGVYNIQVVGKDVHSINLDGDRVACEGSAPRSANAFGEAIADNAAVGFGVVVPLLLLLTAAAARWSLRVYRLSTAEERRAHQFSIALTLLAAFPLAIIGALIFSVIGLG